MSNAKLEEIYKCAVILDQYPEMMAKYEAVLNAVNKYPVLIPYFQLESIDKDYSLTFRAIIGDVRVGIKFGVGGNDQPDLNSCVSIGCYNQFKSALLSFSEKSLRAGCQALMEALEKSEQDIKADSRVEVALPQSQDRSINSNNDPSNIQ